MKVANIVGRPEDIRTHAPSHELVDSSIFIGMEVEAEGCEMRWLREGCPLSSLWDVVEDGSLRNQGLEFIFSGPSKGADIVRAIREVSDVGTLHNLRISDRTGIHVHLDVRDMEWSALRKLCALYAMTERALFSFAGSKRDRNIFCLPWYSAEATLRTLKKIGGAPDKETSVRYALESMHKYSALNLAALLQHGTLEFRHLPTTFEYERLVTWVNIILSLKRYALSFTGSTQELCNQVSMLGPQRFMTDVFGEELMRRLQYTNAFTDLFKGMRLAQELQESWVAMPAYRLLPGDTVVSGDDDLISLFKKTHNL